MKWPVVDRAGIKERNFSISDLKRRIRLKCGGRDEAILIEGRMRRVHINTFDS
jgi:hypothetical protein